MTDPGTPSPAADEPLDDPRAPLWTRLGGFVVVLALLGLLVTIVVIRDRHRDEQAGRAGTTARTFALPADNGGSLVPTTRAPAPTGTSPGTLARTARTNNEVALSLESVLKRDSGFSQKVSCTPDAPLRKGEVLDCHAASEPPIREAPPSTVLAVVIDDEGHFVYGQKQGDGYTIATLTADPNLGCDGLVQRGYAYSVVLAYYEANDRPASLDPNGKGRPCEGVFSSSDIDATLSGAR